MNAYKGESRKLRPLENPHPGIDLVRVFGRFEKLIQETGNAQRFDRRELMRKLGFEAPKSGAAHTLISAMVHFGLIEKTDSYYMYSELANKLRTSSPDSPEWNGLIKEVALSPELYRKLYDEYALNLPDDIYDKLVRRYRKRNITASNVQKIVEYYKRSMAFAKLTADSQTVKHEAPSQDTGAASSSEYVEVSFNGATISIYKKYLIEAYKKTRDEEFAKLNETLR